MKQSRYAGWGAVLLTLTFSIPFVTKAHEAYVLDNATFTEGLRTSSLQVFQSLRDPVNVHMFFLIGLLIGVSLVVSLFITHSRLSSRISHNVEKLAHYGPLILRLTVGIALFFSAEQHCFFGPELQLSQTPYPQLFQVILYILSGFILLGLLTRYAAAAAILVWLISLSWFGGYLFTYTNYLGELVALFIFGAGRFSTDNLFGLRHSAPASLQKYEIVIVRICYGIALIFAAITVKLLHPTLTVAVVNTYNLTQFHWLFPHDPLFITLGAALSELMIGLFILLGLQMRFIILISLFYITLSLAYFGEAVWPHLILYGISFNLLVNKNYFGLDGWIHKKFFTHA